MLESCGQLLWCSSTAAAVRPRIKTRRNRPSERTARVSERDRDIYFVEVMAFGSADGVMMWRRAASQLFLLSMLRVRAVFVS